MKIFGGSSEFRWQAGPFEIGGVLRDHEGNFPYVLFRKVPDIMIFLLLFSV